MLIGMRTRRCRAGGWSSWRWLGGVLFALGGTVFAMPAQAGCPRERHVFHGEMRGWPGNTQTIEWGSRWIWANGGDRLIVSAVGEYPDSGYWEL